MSRCTLGENDRISGSRRIPVLLGFDKFGTSVRRPLLISPFTVESTTGGESGRGTQPFTQPGEALGARLTAQASRYISATLDLAVFEPDT